MRPRKHEIQSRRTTYSDSGASASVTAAAASSTPTSGAVIVGSGDDAPGTLIVDVIVPVMIVLVMRVVYVLVISSLGSGRPVALLPTVSSTIPSQTNVKANSLSLLNSTSKRNSRPRTRLSPYRPRIHNRTLDLRPIQHIHRRAHRERRH